MPLSTTEQTFADMMAFAAKVDDARDADDRLRSLHQHEEQFLADYRAVNDMHAEFLGKCTRLYGYDAVQMKLLRAWSDAMRRRQLLDAKAAYVSACDAFEMVEA
jgi:hypothetical protein